MDWKIALCIALALFTSNAKAEDVLTNKRFISEGVCQFVKGGETYCALYEDDQYPNHYFLAIYHRERLIVVKRVSKTNLNDQENVWQSVKGTEV